MTYGNEFYSKLQEVIESEFQLYDLKEEEKNCIEIYCLI
jgi:hypothetical protein